jgi:SAM-dependent methyltransferase
MDFYSSIAEYYNHIFPLNRAQVSFIQNSFKEPQKLSLLDIGCGTGNLTRELSEIFNKVVGIDLDDAMLAKTKIANIEKNTNLHFLNINMLNIEKEFGSNSFDAIVCFGNTLVHLNSEETILDFFIKSREVLKNKGKLLFQIINYDRIIDKGINGLPTIENSVIKFERNYTYHADNNIIDFETILTIKEDNRQINNNIQLYPVRKSQIEKLLKKAGFSDIRFYSNFKKDEHTSDSIPLVVEVLN